MKSGRTNIRNTGNDVKTGTHAQKRNAVADDQRDAIKAARRLYDNPEDTPGKFIHWHNSFKISKKEENSNSNITAKKVAFIGKTGEYSNFSENTVKLHEMLASTTPYLRESTSHGTQKDSPCHLSRDGTPSRLWSNVHLSRPATPQPTPPCEELPNVELDMFRMSNLISRMETTFTYVEETRLSLATRVCESNSFMAQISDLLRHLLKHLYCTRDVYRLGTSKMFSIDVKQDIFFKEIGRVSDIVDTNIPREGVLFGRSLRDVIETVINGGISTFRDVLPEEIYDIIAKRVSSPLCPEPKYAPLNFCKKDSGTKKQSSAANKGRVSLNRRNRNLELKEMVKQDDPIMEVSKSNGPTKDDGSVSADSGDSPDSGQSYKWPLLNTADQTMVQKEQKLHSLMSEIDSLMEDVGLCERINSGYAYEVIMGTPTVKQKAKDGKSEAEMAGKSASDTKTLGKRLIDIGVSKKPIAHNRRGKMSSQFDDDLDKLLDSC